MIRFHHVLLWMSWNGPRVPGRFRKKKKWCHDSVGMHGGGGGSQRFTQDFEFLEFIKIREIQHSRRIFRLSLEVGRWVLSLGWG